MINLSTRGNSAKTNVDGILGELTQEVTEGNLTLLGFPPVPDSDIPTCGEWPLCNRTGM